MLTVIEARVRLSLLIVRVYQKTWLRANFLDILKVHLPGLALIVKGSSNSQMEEPSFSMKLVSFL